jgi:hypothetical protein
MAAIQTILLIGESGVGKTHYGAQLLNRLMNEECQLRMDGAASNLEPFENALECLANGRAADHTPISIYTNSSWPIIDREKRKTDLVWPDYGGEQIKKIIETRHIPASWKSRAEEANAWMLMLRLQKLSLADDIFSRPSSTENPSLPELDEASVSTNLRISDQARLIELLQMLVYVRQANFDEPLLKPRLVILLSCWDELGEADLPLAELRKRMPMFCNFVESNWKSVIVFGLSALGRRLDPKGSDTEYAQRGPEKFGFVVAPDGARSPDLTLPIRFLMSEESASSHAG